MLDGPCYELRICPTWPAFFREERKEEESGGAGRREFTLRISPRAFQEFQDPGYGSLVSLGVPPFFWSKRIPGPTNLGAPCFFFFFFFFFFLTHSSGKLLVNTYTTSPWYCLGLLCFKPFQVGNTLVCFHPYLGPPLTRNGSPRLMNPWLIQWDSALLEGTGFYLAVGQHHGTIWGMHHPV